jgi:hypothetical protein
MKFSQNGKNISRKVAKSQRKAKLFVFLFKTGLKYFLTRLCGFAREIFRFDLLVPLVRVGYDLNLIV